MWILNGSKGTPPFWGSSFCVTHPCYSFSCTFWFRFALSCHFELVLWFSLAQKGRFQHQASAEGFPLPAKRRGTVPRKGSHTQTCGAKPERLCSSAFLSCHTSNNSKWAQQASPSTHPNCAPQKAHDVDPIFMNHPVCCWRGVHFWAKSGWSQTTFGAKTTPIDQLELVDLSWG